MILKDMGKYDISKGQSFHSKSIKENVKDTVKLVEFFNNYLMKRKVQTIFLVQGVQQLKKRPRFANFSTEMLISKINNLCQVFPNYMRIKKHPQGNLLNVNRNIKLNQIVNQIYNLKDNK
jgi:hypothetical protein